MLVRRLIQLINRKKVAVKLGIRFNRCSTFVLPEQIVIKGQHHRLSLPDEHGIKVAFIDLLLDDCYGCRELDDPVKTVLDIGANVGLFGITAREAFPDAIIHSYEPNPHLEQYLRNQARVGSFEYFMEAIGLESSKVMLHFKWDSVLTRTENDHNGNIT